MMPTQNSTVKESVGIIRNDMRYMASDIAEIKKALQENYVTKDQFAPVKRIVYGALSFILAVFVTAFGYIISSGGKK